MRKMRVEDRPSPNFGPRAGGIAPDMVVLHYTGMPEREEAIARLLSPASEVSAHYVLLRSGGIVRMVDERHRAWHAGASRWGDIDDVNSHSIGIELVNPGHDQDYHPFPHPQMEALEQLLAELMARWSIPPERVVGHACVAPGRKIDPGEKFDWRRLAGQGLSVWLDGPRRGAAEPGADPLRFQRAARAFGYGALLTGAWDRPTRDCWDAFIARFRPAEAGEEPHAAGIEHLEALAARWPVRLDATVAGA